MYRARAPSQGSTSGENTPPPLQGIDAVDPIKSTFELYEEVPYAVTLGISGSGVKVVAWHLRGADVKGGADEKVLEDWFNQRLLRSRTNLGGASPPGRAAR